MRSRACPGCDPSVSLASGSSCSLADGGILLAWAWVVKFDLTSLIFKEQHAEGFESRPLRPTPDDGASPQLRPGTPVPDRGGEGRDAAPALSGAAGGAAPQGAPGRGNARSPRGL